MKFEVYSSDNRRMMSTESRSCVPTDLLGALSKAGYKFKWDGKSVNIKTILQNLEMTTEPKKVDGDSKTYVYCKEVDKYYNKQCEAAADLGIDPALVSYSIKTGKPQKGYTFCKVIR